MSKRKSTSRARTNKGPWKYKIMEQRQKDAEARQTERNKLTPQQQLAKLDSLGFIAAKERARLLRQIESKKN